MDTNVIKFDISEVNELLEKWRNAPTEVKARVQRICRAWASRVEQEYRGSITYGSGFRRAPASANGRAYSKVTTKQNNLRVEVGHESFIAKFVEVGTKAHKITTKHATIRHPGITGSFALQIAWNRNLNSLTAQLEQTLNETLNNGG